MNNELENITCDICRKIKWAFVDVETEKDFMITKRFRVCVDCFKDEDIEFIIKKEMKKQTEQQISFHQKKIDEINKRIEATSSNRN